jgi:hypothetical protein
VTTLTAQGRPRPAAPPGVVAVRLCGAHADVAALASLLVAMDWDGQLELTGVSDPRANRWEPGERVYLTVRLPGRCAGVAVAAAIEEGS